MLAESSQLSAVLEQSFQADKLNIAALGNIVPQLHIHHIVRYKTDPAWPNPVWGHQPAAPYADESAYKRSASLTRQLADFTPFNGF